MCPLSDPGVIYIAFVPFQFLALGTHFGKVFLLDIQGNVTQKFEIVSTLKSIEIDNNVIKCIRYTSAWDCSAMLGTNANIVNHRIYYLLIHILHIFCGPVTLTRVSF